MILTQVANTAGMELFASSEPRTMDRRLAKYNGLQRREGGAAPHSGMTVNSIGGGGGSGEVITEEQGGKREEGNQSIKAEDATEGGRDALLLPSSLSVAWAEIALEGEECAPSPPPCDRPRHPQSLQEHKTQRFD